MAGHQPAGVHEELIAFEGTTTSAGNAGGTTLICSSLTQGTNYWINMSVIMLSGNSKGQIRRISAFTTATNTITVDTAFASQIVSSTRFAILANHDTAAGAGDASAANQVLILADIGDASASTLGSIYGIVGNPAAGQDLTTRIGYEGATSLAAKLTAARAGYLDELAAANIPADVDTLKQRSVTKVSMMEFWSTLDDIVTLTTATADVDLPNVVVADIPANSTIVRVVGMFKCRAFNNTAAVVNAINGAGVINVKKSTGAYGADDVALITIADNIWSTAATTKEGGMLIEGTNDAASEVDANATYNLRFNGNIFVDSNNLELIDVLVGLKVYFIPT